MTVYPEMNNKIVNLLRMGDTPVELYAAQRIEELELKNMELIDRVLEIIDKQQIIADHGDAVDAGINSACNYIRAEVERLKGEQG